MRGETRSLTASSGAGRLWESPGAVSSLTQKGSTMGFFGGKPKVTVTKPSRAEQKAAQRAAERQAAKDAAAAQKMAEKQAKKDAAKQAKKDEAKRVQASKRRERVSRSNIQMARDADRGIFGTSAGSFAQDKREAANRQYQERERVRRETEARIREGRRRGHVR